jgi:hypothetical protein
MHPTDRATGTASRDQTVAASSGAGHAGSRVDVLATTHTSVNAWPTTTASRRSKSPSAFGASDHAARWRGSAPFNSPYTRSVIIRRGVADKLRAFNEIRSRGARTNVSQSTASCGRSCTRGMCTRTQPVVFPRE